MNEINSELKNTNSNENAPLPKDKNDKKSVKLLQFTNTALILLVVVFIAGTIFKFAFFYKQNQFFHNKTTQIAQPLIMQEIQVIKNSNHNLELKLQQQQLSIQEIQQNNAKIKALAQKTNLIPLMETYNLVRTANLVLLTEGDVVTARELLINAIKTIETIPSFASIKQKLTEDLAKLNTSSFANKNELIIKIDNLMKAIETLPQVPTDFKNNTTNSTTASSVNNKITTENPSLWHRFITNLKKSMQGIVVIQHSKQSMPTLLPDEELSNLKQNLQFKLINAEWAIIHKQPDLYKSSILAVKTWLNKYYSEIVLKNNNILESMNELEKTNLDSTTFNITATVDTINATMSQELSILKN